MELVPDWYPGETHYKVSLVIAGLPENRTEISPDGLSFLNAEEGLFLMGLPYADLTVDLPDLNKEEFCLNQEPGGSIPKAMATTILQQIAVDAKPVRFLTQQKKSWQIFRFSDAFLEWAENELIFEPPEEAKEESEEKALEQALSTLLEEIEQGPEE